MAKLTEKNLLEKLKRGWTLQLWRNSSPHNIWMEGEEREIHFEGKDRMFFGVLKKHCRLRSSEGTVRYPPGLFRGSDEGQAMHEIWEYDPGKEQK